jgi:paraquat-inducible protein B
MQIGTAREPKREFVALTTPPVVQSDTPGRFFVLEARDLGSLDYGTPIFFRRIQVGEVASYKLDQDGHSVTLKVFVNSPYDRFVTANTRFWQASGIDVSLSATGFTVQTQSLLSILVGGIAFETPPAATQLTPAAADTSFKLFDSRAEAFKPHAVNPQTYQLVFNESVHGLAVGAPVEFRGIQIGEVIEVSPQFDPKTFQFSVPVLVRVDPAMFGVRIAWDAAEQESLRRKAVDEMVAHGLRAQLQSGSLLTGALYVAVDFFPDARPATIDWTREPPDLPTVPGEVQQLEASVASIVKKLDAIEFKAIGADLQKAIVELDRTLTSARGTLDNADRLIAPNSALSQELYGTLQEVNRAARGLRVLADYLERHPEALLRGKEGQ